jgi:hypothetical protein
LHFLSARDNKDDLFSLNSMVDAPEVQRRQAMGFHASSGSRLVIKARTSQTRYSICTLHPALQTCLDPSQQQQQQQQQQRQQDVIHDDVRFE